MPVTYTLEGEEWEVGALTLDECESVEKEIGITWGEMNPAISATQAKAILTRFVARSKGLEAARAVVGAMTVSEFADCMKVTPEQEVPKEGVSLVSTSTTTKTNPAA